MRRDVMLLKCLYDDVHEHAFYILGVNMFLRKIAATLTSTSQLVQRPNGRYALHTTAMKIITQTIEFSPNEEFEEKTMDGRKVKSTVVFDGNRMMHTQHGDKPLTIERRFFSDEMIGVTTYGDIICTSWFKLVE